VSKPKFGAFPEYFVDWWNAIRFLWHVFTARLKTRRVNQMALHDRLNLSRSLAKDRNRAA